MLETRRILPTFISLFLALLPWMSVGAFNFDTQFPIVFSGPEGGYFGYTVAMYLKASKYVVLVGAPAANSTVAYLAYKPGGLYCCDINSTLCEDLFDKVSTSRLPLLSQNSTYRMWFGATLDVMPEFHQPLNGHDVVVCGHRCVRHQTSINGMCYLLGQNVTLENIRMLKPLENQDKQYIYDDNDFVYRSYFNNGQAGMSATFSEDGSHLIVGAPGIFEGMGSVFYYNGITSKYDIEQRGKGVKKPPASEKHAYFGYSITSGKFFNLTADQYVVGAPRAENKGKIYMITVSDTTEVSIQDSFKGLDLGGYFGATVQGVNLNGDSFTDLVVGSPLYAHETGCDEGKVTVYISDGYRLRYHTELYGDGNSDARFGTSIATIGDLNKDGFGDFAVGAPYEDGKGAVYIYQGSDTGVIAQYSQKIKAAEIHPDLAGFGIHISRGLDIDDNGYPDIAVGSYISSNAVLLRARPAIAVSAEVYSNHSKIRIDKAECVYSGKNLPCVHVDCCLVYTGRFVPASLDFHCTLFEKDENPRGFFPPYRPKNSALNFNLTLKNDTKMCLTKQFYLHSDIKDIVTPIPLHFSCELAASTVPNDTFDRTYPVVSPYSINNVTSQIPFHSGCDNDDMCYSDLIVEAELRGEANHRVITLGNVSSVSMDISVRNEGEPAYSAELLIYLPTDVPIINKDFCVTKNKAGREVIACDLGNPLVKDKQVNILIKLDLTKIAPHTKFVEIFLEALTNSSEINPIDNILNISLEVKKISDIGIRGTPSHYLILYQEDHEMSSQITHKFTVGNYGPSPLQTIDILLQVPHVVMSYEEQKPFLHLTALQTDGTSENILPAVCGNTSQDLEIFLHTVPGPEGDSWENQTMYYNEPYSTTTSGNRIIKRDVMQASTEGSVITSNTEMGPDNSWEERRSFRISCDDENFECITIQCSVSSLADARKFAEIAVAFRVNYTTLKEHFGEWYQIEFLTTGSISIADNNVFLLPHHSDVTSVKTVLHNDSRSPKEIPHWLFSVGAFLGSMVLFQIIFLLIKVGFFRRKEKELLDRLEQSFSASNNDEAFLINPSDDSSTDNE